MGAYSRWALIKFSPFSASSKFINKTQIAVINIFKIRILLNLTFRMFVHIHFQKYNRYGFISNGANLYSGGGNGN